MTVDYSLRPATMEDREFMMLLERNNIEQFPSIMKLFDADYQKYYYDNFFNPKHVSIIEYANRPIGAQSVIIRRKDIFIMYVHLLPEFHNKGIDDSIIHNTLQRAENEQKPVITCVFKEDIERQRMWQNLGFQIFNEDDLRWRVKWEPPLAS